MKEREDRYIMPAYVIVMLKGSQKTKVFTFPKTVRMGNEANLLLKTSVIFPETSQWFTVETAVTWENIFSIALGRLNTWRGLLLDPQYFFASFLLIFWFFFCHCQWTCTSLCVLILVSICPSSCTRVSWKRFPRVLERSGESDRTCNVLTMRISFLV